MSSKQQGDPSLHTALAMFNSQVVCTVLAENRQQSSPTKSPSAIRDNEVDRRSSTPTASNRLVGSNRYAFVLSLSFIFIIKIDLYFSLDFSFKLKNNYRFVFKKIFFQ